MSFDWSAYLTLANYMMAQVDEFPDEEACYRSVVSRAYYAVYGLARNYARETDAFVSYGNDHQALQQHFLNHSHKIRKKLGNQLRMLHQHRKKADYDDNLDELPINKASRALAQARKIITTLEQLSA